MRRFGGPSTEMERQREFCSPGSNLFSLDRASRDEVALFLAKATLAAGPAVMEEYDQGCSVASKEDGSPVTSADHRAEAIICEYLASLAPMPPVCAEESMAAGAKAQVAERFLLVDPLDGTREFLAGNGEFTINVALIERGAPSPARSMRPRSVGCGSGAKRPSRVKRSRRAELPGQGSRRRMRTRSAPSSLVAFASRSHLNSQSDSFLKKLPIGETRFAGSSLKFCLIAEGLGDVYPRFAPTMEWDTAAGDAVLRAAGGGVLDPSGSPLSYGKIDKQIAQWPVHRVG